jgi:hypothetical protein
MSAATPTVYAKARAETCALLGYDLDGLTAEQATRLDITTALRLALDDQSGKLARGETVDVTKLLAASEALAKLFPPLRDPPRPHNDRDDPRAEMLRIYMEMRERGEIPPEGTLQAEINRLKAENERLRAELTAANAGTPVEPAPQPPPDNVVPASASAPSSPQPPQPVSAAESRRRMDAVNAIQPPSGYLKGPPEPWRRFYGDNGRWEV